MICRRQEAAGNMWETPGTFGRCGMSAVHRICVSGGAKLATVRSLSPGKQLPAVTSSDSDSFSGSGSGSPNLNQSRPQR